MQMTAFLGECFRRRSPNAFRRSGDEDTLAAQVKVHGVLLIESGAAEAIILNGRLKQQLQNDVRRRGLSWLDLFQPSTSLWRLRE
jgi:hypothetical protein